MVRPCEQSERGRERHRRKHICQRQMDRKRPRYTHKDRQKETDVHTKRQTERDRYTQRPDRQRAHTKNCAYLERHGGDQSQQSFRWHGLHHLQHDFSGHDLGQVDDAIWRQRRQQFHRLLWSLALSDVEDDLAPDTAKITQSSGTFN